MAAHGNAEDRHSKPFPPPAHGHPVASPAPPAAISQPSPVREATPRAPLTQRAAPSQAPAPRSEDWFTRQRLTGCSQHLQRNFRSRLWQVIGNSAVCPIVYNVLERLKQHLGFDESSSGEPPYG